MQRSYFSSSPPSQLSTVSSAAGRSRRLVREMVGGGIACLALLGLFGRFVVPGVVGHQRDTGAFYYPLTAWFAQELLAGRFPLWCPLIFAGYPIVADGEIGMLYPPNVLALLLLPVDVAFIVVRTSNYLLAALGVYGLARVLGLGRSGSIFGGIAFALGGFMIGHLDHGNILRSAAWLPAVLCFADLALRAMDRRRWLWIALGAGALTLAGLGLHPQILLIDLVALAAFAGLRAVAGVAWAADGWRADRRHAARSLVLALGRAVLVVGLISALGLAGAAIQLVPTYELGAASSRGDGLAYAQAAAGGLAPVDLLTLILPYGFRADPAVQWMRYPYWESTVYVGVVGLLLAGLGLAFGRRRVVLPLAGLGLLGLLLAMADHAPVSLYAWLWSLPGFSSMRAPVRYTLVFELALALLAAAGLDSLRAARAPRRAGLAALATAALVAATVAGAAALQGWIAEDETRALDAIRETYLTLPRDRPSLAPSAVRDGLLGTLRLENCWTLLALVSGLGMAALLLLWGRRRQGAGWLAGAVMALGVAELLVVAHGFHPTTTREELRQASRPLRFLSQQAGPGRTFLAGRSDLSITSRPAQFGVAQAYGYSSLPTARMERYWTRVNEVDDDLLDLWGVRYVVEPKHAPARTPVHAVYADPARPLLDGPAHNSLGTEQFRLAPTAGDTLRVLGSLARAEAVQDGELVAEIVVSGPGTAPVTLAVRAGQHLGEAAYDAIAPPPAHRKPTVGLRWEPRDPAGRVYPRDIYVADLALPEPMVVEQIEVRTVARHGSLRLVGLGVLDSQANVIRSVLPSHRAKYTPVYEDDVNVILENRQAKPRAYLVPRAVAVRADDWSIVSLTDAPLDPRTTAVLEREGVAPGQTEPVLDGEPLAPGEGVEIVRATPDRAIMRVRAREARYLVMADSYFPGWYAWIDGRAVTVERAGYLFRAVRVPPGEHLVEWRYQPTSLYAGAAVSLGALAVLVVLAAAGLGSRQVVPAFAPRRQPAVGPHAA